MYYWYNHTHFEMHIGWRFDFDGDSGYCLLLMCRSNLSVISHELYSLTHPWGMKKLLQVLQSLKVRRFPQHFGVSVVELCTKHSTSNLAHVGRNKLAIETLPKHPRSQHQVPCLSTFAPVSAFSRHRYAFWKWIHTASHLEQIISAHFLTTVSFLNLVWSAHWRLWPWVKTGQRDSSFVL